MYSGRVKVFKLDAPTYALWWMRCGRCAEIGPVASDQVRAFRLALLHTLHCRCWTENAIVRDNMWRVGGYAR